MLKREGYVTAAFVPGGVLTLANQLDQGFEGAWTEGFRMESGADAVAGPAGGAGQDQAVLPAPPRRRDAPADAGRCRGSGARALGRRRARDPGPRDRRGPRVDPRRSREGCSPAWTPSRSSSPTTAMRCSNAPTRRCSGEAAASSRSRSTCRSRSLPQECSRREPSVALAAWWTCCPPFGTRWDFPHFPPRAGAAGRSLRPLGDRPFGPGIAGHCGGVAPRWCSTQRWRTGTVPPADLSSGTGRGTVDLPRPGTSGSTPSSPPPPASAMPRHGVEAGAAALAGPSRTPRSGSIPARRSRRPTIGSAAGPTSTSC